ncbi:MAG: hypothetical protein DRJ62_06030 [Thermoprotei archaeon]|nr:MAG: hypothetical protein DRJ62_06030 [Thermoprotei archaeon]
MIIVECYAEVVLIETLGFNDIRHEENKAAVIEELKKRAGSHVRVVGLVDEDPSSPWPSYWRRFRQIKASGHGFSVWAGPGGNVYAILLHPRHEEWIYDVARRYGFNVRNYHLPQSRERFWSLLHSGRRTRRRVLSCYRKLLEDMLRKGCPALTGLKAELRSLLKNVSA